MSIVKDTRTRHHILDVALQAQLIMAAEVTTGIFIDNCSGGAEPVGAKPPLVRADVLLRTVSSSSTLVEKSGAS